VVCDRPQRRRRVRRAHDAVESGRNRGNRGGSLLERPEIHKLVKEISMRPMFLSEVEHSTPGGPYAHRIDELQAAGDPVPQIMHLFAYKPDRTGFLSRFTQDVMRGPSPLPAGLRELIAAFTSRRNDCLF
jgi:hypothetical protein